jgi:mannose-6-phosphate isomerase-like protein (cupin superfamily)
MMPNPEFSSDAEMPVEKFQIFRAGDAPDLMAAGCMSVEPFSAVQRAGLDKVQEAGYGDGDVVRVLVNIPGFSLTHVWFKKDYPLPLHSHDADCLYYIVAGSVRLGNQDLGARDSFFIPSGVPYAYRPGPDGVELLEFRHATQFNFRNLAKGAAFWEKAVETVAANRDGWQKAQMPALNVEEIA